ncbi:MAG: isocitrate/isopropylmalate family dehydrogenase [Candidatus Thermoplasmatota archaeon]|nr:isocitrate/isopropylmalate family dehydrogenase [Candidatus Thermoplasmatota archaeon]
MSCIKSVTDDSVEFVEFDISAERYLDSGRLLSEEEINQIRSMDSVLFGAVGDPRVRPGILERGIIIKLRTELDLFMNLRPSWSLPFSSTKFNIAVARENTEEFYIGFGGKLEKSPTTFSYSSQAWKGNVKISGDTDDDVYFNVGMMSRRNTERYFEMVCDLADERKVKEVTVVDKANAVPGIYDIWRETGKRVLEKHGIGPSFMYGDAVAYGLVMKPDRFNLIAASNLYGDILSDLCSGLMGGLGFTPSGNYGTGRIALFEPVHGSAPDIAGKGVANPIGTILSSSMMLKHLGMKKESRIIREAVDLTISQGIRTFDIGGSDGTSKVTQAIMKNIEQKIIANDV